MEKIDLKMKPYAPGSADVPSASGVCLIVDLYRRFTPFNRFNLSNSKLGLQARRLHADEDVRVPRVNTCELGRPQG